MPEKIFRSLSVRDLGERVNIAMIDDVPSVPISDFGFSPCHAVQSFPATGPYTNRELKRFRGG